MISTDITPYASGLSCPRCQSTRIVKNGTYKHRQNYLCKDCRKTLSTNTGTAISGIHKREKFMEYTKCLEEGLTIKQAAKQLGIAISTSFAWRHKHLSALKAPKSENFQRVKFISIIKTKYSEKGNKTSTTKLNRKPTRNIICRDIQGNTLIQTFTNSKELDHILKAQNIKKGSNICKANAQLKFAFDRQNVKSNPNKELKEKHLHIASQTEDLLNEWLYKFRGVATKYLQRYWNWFAHQKDESVYQWESLTNKNARSEYLTLSKLKYCS